ncbi:MAG: hypothetical protein IPK82_25640 [Polyangiaceae bacterium]|nr:hypothetical protein [Polyangiaceae bacterium]
MPRYAPNRRSSSNAALATTRFHGAAALVYTYCFVSSCSTDPPPPPPQRVHTAAPTAAAVDRVDPNEVLEGTEKAFGFPLPHKFVVEHRFKDAVQARGEVPFERLVAYVRSRVIATSVETGPTTATFKNATLKDNPTLNLDIHIWMWGGEGLGISVRDVTRLPAKDIVKPTDPWDQPGFDPKDRKVDPKRFE